MPFSMPMASQHLKTPGSEETPKNQLHESSGCVPETSYELLGKNGRLVVWGLEGIELLGFIGKYEAPGQVRLPLQPSEVRRRLGDAFALELAPHGSGPGQDTPLRCLARAEVQREFAHSPEPPEPDSRGSHGLDAGHEGLWRSRESVRKCGGCGAPVCSACCSLPSAGRAGIQLAPWLQEERVRGDPRSLTALLIAEELLCRRDGDVWEVLRADERMAGLRQDRSRSASCRQLPPQPATLTQVSTLCRQVPPVQTFGLSAARDAHNALTSGRSVGKLVVVT